MSWLKLLIVAGVLCAVVVVQAGTSTFKATSSPNAVWGTLPNDGEGFFSPNTTIWDLPRIGGLSRTPTWDYVSPDVPDASEEPPQWH